MAGFGKDTGPWGFGKQSGPSLPPKTHTIFGASPPSSSPLRNPPTNPSPPTNQSQRLGTRMHFPFDSRSSEAFIRTRSTPLFNGGNHSMEYPQEETQRPQVSQWGVQPNFPVNNANVQVGERPLLSYVDLDDPGSGFPSKPANFQVPKRTRSPPLLLTDKISLGNLQYAQGDIERPSGSPKWGIPAKSPVNDTNGQAPRWTPSITPYGDQDDPRTRLPTRPADFHVSKMTRSPPLPSADKVPLGNLKYAGSSKAPLSTSSAPSAFRSDQFDDKLHYPFEEAQRTTISPPAWGNQPKSPVSYANSLNSRKLMIGATGVDTNNADAGTRVRTKTAKSSNFQVPKRTRSSTLSSSAEVLPGNSPSIQDDIERETQAKAKRFARFNAELSQPLQSLHDPTKNKADQAPVNKQKVVTKHLVQEVGDLSNINTSFDYEGLQSSRAVIGLCLDMCPESERDERERKGDLDKYERLDGDRNQTSRSLAVKKYTRTAEREAELIRPMSVLQKTINYLLGLLDQPYDDSFLGMYNFLWDRMRAIRMDLRMQHIFNRDAITMLEQMIRLHIIAMHELCEYTKGEGFSEGFDAHLNIEQMNKASAELFQLYDDHRKKGINVPSEKEFRGYYALLKLDRHPGYKVEPAELSLDLAKMPPEIRSTPEVIFARDVARACRTGNFMAFFRLARRATYVQACLMHAHFAKLRTQALASLHSGLQNNQGIPVVQVVQWLGMEGEDIESLLEYHGFLIKKFEDAYMVKDGPFLNSDVDYKTKCSQLVHLKKSRKIMDDVAFSQALLSLPNEDEKIVVNKEDTFDKRSVHSIEAGSLSDVADEDMPDYEDDSAPKDFHQVHPTLEVPSLIGQEDENGTRMDVVGVCSLSTEDESFGHYLLETEVGESAPNSLIDSSQDINQWSPPKEILLQSPERRFSRSGTFGALRSPCAVENKAPQEVIMKQLENEAMLPYQDTEAAAAKLKLILRIWKQRSSRRRELREQRQMAASAALSSLSLGLPLWQNEAQQSHTSELNIDNVVRERLYVQRESWSRLNVSEVVLPVLKERNPGSKCICWKLVTCSQMNDMGGDRSTQEIQSNHLAGTWLVSKLMSSRKADGELVISSSRLSIWSKWVSDPQICCLSVIRDVSFDGRKPIVEDDAVSGASAILFLASERIPWELQRMRLNNLLMSVPLGSSLPLLILIDGPCREDIPDPSFPIVNKLGLHYIDETQICTFSVVFLSNNSSSENINGFFSDDKLREGLKWLANQSPVQPVLLEVKTHELVLSRLCSLLEALESKGDSEVGPDDCILTFNEALDRSVQEIMLAADMNKSRWPCPEIHMLDKSSCENRTVSMCLPIKDWSSSQRIRCTINPIKGCRLPSFATDLSWLNKGSNMGKEIQNHKMMLEKCLTWYLTQASEMMGENLAAREASVILQTGAGLELDGLTYRIVPRWVMIFRRIFNWRLMNLVQGTFSIAFVLEHPSTPSTLSSETSSLFTPRKSSERDTDIRTPMWKGLNDFGLGRHQWSHYASSKLTLDEIIEVGCQLPLEHSESVAAAVEPFTSTVNIVGVVLEASHGSADGEDLQPDGFAESGNDSLYDKRNRSTEKVTEVKDTDRLSMLLEQCNMLQDMIGEKLSIYF